MPHAPTAASLAASMFQGPAARPCLGCHGRIWMIDLLQKWWFSIANMSTNSTTGFGGEIICFWGKHPWCHCCAVGTSWDSIYWACPGHHGWRLQTNITQHVPQKKKLIEGSTYPWDHPWSIIITRQSGFEYIINGNFRILKWRYLPYITPIYGLCKGISPENMAKHMVLTYLQFRFLKWPLT